MCAQQKPSDKEGWSSFLSGEATGGPDDGRWVQGKESHVGSENHGSDKMVRVSRKTLPFDND